MPILPPNSVYPIDYDTDSTLFKVYNTTETTLSSDLSAWATTINITPIAATDDEIWAENGYATISGELIYYDDVQRDGNQKINALINCVRNLGGNAPQFNELGTWIRGFVLAEHHNNLARAIVNSENFIGINLSPDKITLDWRIRNLTQPEFVDDYGCPQVNFIYYITDIDPLLGTTISYFLEIIGVYDSFILEFGDNTLTNSELSGTHIYPPNSTIDPTVTVYSALCQTVNSAVSRNQPNEPLITVVPDEQNITIDPIADFPDLQYITDPNTSADLNLPPIVFPCLDIGPFGPINIPSTIIIDPPFIIPSQIMFSNIPIIANTVSISPVNIEVVGDQFIELVCIPLGSGSGAATGSSGAGGPVTGDKSPSPTPVPLGPSTGLNYSGYAIGGAANNISVGTANKVLYRTDTISALASAALPNGSFKAGATVTANSDYGYIAGGISQGYTNSFFRLQFSNETTSAYTSVTLSSNRSYGAGLSHGDTSGYFTGGVPTLTINDKLTYSSGTISTLASIQLNPGRYVHGSASNQYDKGYLAGGISGSNAALSNTSLLVYSTDTYSAKTTDDLKAARQRLGSVDGNNAVGFFAGGSGNLSSTIFLKSIEKIHYPSDTTVAMYGVLTTAKINLGGLNEGSSKGYWLGGNTAASTSSMTNTIESYHYINDIVSALYNTLTQTKTNMACISRVWINASTTTPTTTPAFAMNSVETIQPNIPQFITLSNGYVVPDEASENTNYFDLAQNGYDSNSTAPTPDHEEFKQETQDIQLTIKNAMQDSFKTMKLMIKDNQILPDTNELLGE